MALHLQLVKLDGDLGQVLSVLFPQLCDGLFLQEPINFKCGLEESISAKHLIIFSHLLNYFLLQLENDVR